MSDQQGPGFKPWEQIETSPEFRRLAPDQQARFRVGWWNDIAPQVYGPLLQDQQAAGQLYQRIVRSPAIPYVEGEDEIIRPETLSIDSFNEIHQNERFAQMSFEEQQAVKSVWFNRTLANNPQLREELGPEGINTFYQNLMRRAPAYGSRFEGWLNKAEDVTGLLAPLRVNEQQEVEDISRFAEIATRFNQNFIKPAMRAATSLGIGPARAILGEDSELAQILGDLDKEQQWVNQTYDVDNGFGRFLTTGLPTLVGYMGGLVAGGAYIPFENMLAGHSVVQAGKVVTRPGLIQKGAQAVGLGGPDIAYQIAGGSIAGAVQGMTDALSQGKPWHSNLVTDASIGVGAEIASRFLQNHLLLRQVMKETQNARVREGLNTLLDRKPGDTIPAELKEIINTNPDLRNIVHEMDILDKDGFLMQWAKSREGVETKAKLLGLEVEFRDDAARVLRNGEEVYRTEGVEEVQINALNDYIDSAPERWDLWAQSAENKSILELLQSQPEAVKVTVGNIVPQESRATILRTLEDHNIHIPGARFEGIRPQTPQRVNIEPDGRPLRSLVATEDTQWINAPDDIKALSTRQIRPGVYRFDDSPTGIRGNIKLAGDTTWEIEIEHPTHGLISLGEAPSKKEARRIVTDAINLQRQGIRRGGVQNIVEFEIPGSAVDKTLITPEGVYQRLMRRSGGTSANPQYENILNRITGKSYEELGRFANYDEADNAIKARMNAAGIDDYRLPEFKKSTPPEILSKYRLTEFPSEPIRASSTTGTVQTTTAQPHTALTEIDSIYHTLRSSLSVKKKAERLGAMGITFDGDPEMNRAAIKQLMSTLAKQVPDHPVVYANARTMEVLEPHNIPLVAVTSDFIKAPQMASQVLVATPKKMRDVFSTIRQSDINMKTQASKKAKGTSVTIMENFNRNSVEVEFKVPGAEGHLETATLYFPSISSAKAALVDGQFQSFRGGKRFNANWFIEQPEAVWDIMASGKTLPKGLKPQSDSVYESFKAFAKENKIQSPKRGAVDFLPYAYASHMADQHGYHLAIYNGKYIIQDIMEGADSIKLHNFDTLNDVFQFLQKNRRADAMPPLEGNLSHGALEEVTPGGLDKVLDRVPYAEAKKLSRFTVRDHLRVMLAPAQYVVRHFENLKATDELNKLAMNTLGKEFSPTKIFNTVVDSLRGQRAFIMRRQQYLDSLRTKRMKPRQSTLIYEWIEAMDSPDEGITAYDKALKARQRSRTQVYEQMVKEFGEPQAQEMRRLGAVFENYFDELFSLTGMNWNSFIKRYVPHIRADLQVGAQGGFQLSYKRFGMVPDTDKKLMIEMLREGDPRELALETDIFKAAEIYTHLVGRMLYARPMLQEQAGLLRSLMTQMRKSSLDQEEWKIVVDYFSNMINSIEGIRTGMDSQLRYAATRSLEVMMERINKGMNLKGDNAIQIKRALDPIGRLISLSTGAHLAARPFPIFRNLGQSIVFGSVLGHRWWGEGLTTMLNDPTALTRLKELGVTVGHNVVPAGVGQQMTGGSLISHAMEGYKWSDSVNRGITYFGMKARAERAVQRYAAGKIDAKKFVQESGARLFGRGNYNQLIKMVNTMKVKDLAVAFPDRIARLAVDHTQFLYDKFAQPSAFRHGVGRLFGQYTSWPINFFSFFKNVVASDSMTIGERAKVVVGMLAATNAIAQGLHEAGINSRNFQPMQMGIMSPGPYYQLMADLVAGVNGDISSWRAAGRAMFSFVPFGYETEGIIKALSAFNEGEMYEGILHIMSAPPRYDLYPRREVPMDALEDWWNAIGFKYVQFKNSGNERMERRSDIIRDLWSIIQ